MMFSCLGYLVFMGFLYLDFMRLLDCMRRFDMLGFGP